jgi:hypothetical protein
VIEVAVIGAGPYGLSAASHLRSAGIESRVIGEPMDLWRRHMPNGMLLRSAPRASSIADPAGQRTFVRWAADDGVAIPDAVPLSTFLRYAAWFQEREVPEIDRRRVSTIEVDVGGFTIALDDGERLSARRVIVAAGQAQFARRPPPFAEPASSRIVHTSDLSDLAGFDGRRVLVVGAGQSALEAAALLHEAGAHVELVAREPVIAWLPGDTGSGHVSVGGGADPVPARTRRGIQPPPTLGRLVSERCTRPAGSAWIRPRLAGVEVTLRRGATRLTTTAAAIRVELDDGSVREVETVVLGTGYAVDVRRYSFLSSELLASLRLRGGAPVLGRGFESNIARLHFLGAAAAASFGPLLNFVVGTWYAGPALVDNVLGCRGRLRLGIPPE